MERKKLIALAAVGLFSGSVALMNYGGYFDESTKEWTEEDEEGTVESVWDDDSGHYQNYWHSNGGGYYWINRTPYMHPDARYSIDNPVYGASRVMQRQNISMMNPWQGGAEKIAHARQTGRISYDNPLKNVAFAQNLKSSKDLQSALKNGIGKYSTRSSAGG